MSDENDDSPEAFPTLDDCGSGLALRKYGMSLRDYFAAKSMNGIIAGLEVDANIDLHPPSIAKSSYAIADAMLKARNG